LRVLSGIQPSGRLHIGNFFGAMRQHLKLQAEHNCFYFIADYHALTSNPAPDDVASLTLGVAMDYIALGLDIEKTIFWRQSDVPEVTELTWLLSCITPMGLLQRCTSYKDKVAQGLSPNHGLFAYPVLQAADILIFQSDLVPVGADQKQHIEVTRDIAIRFNNTYGEIFTVPKEHIIECNVFALLKLVASSDELCEWDNKYRAGGLGYGQAKKRLAELMIDYFKPYRQKRAELENNMDYVKEVLANGAERAKSVAGETLEKARQAVGLRR